MADKNPPADRNKTSSSLRFLDYLKKPAVVVPMITALLGFGASEGIKYISEERKSRHEAESTDRAELLKQLIKLSESPPTTSAEAQRQIDRLAYLELIFRTGLANEEIKALKKALESQRTSLKGSEDAAEEERRKREAMAKTQSQAERRKVEEAAEVARKQSHLDKMLADKSARAARERLVRINPRFL